MVNHEFESIDLSDEVSKGKLIKQAIRNGIASHVQTVGKGGLLVTLAKISAHYDLGPIDYHQSHHAFHQLNKSYLLL
jgi:phosphoribosylformylglycinamidine (FGAM) synthase-like enzyme